MLHAVIMAGGIGARFWPVSRRQKPKQMLDLFGSGTLLEQTIARIEPLVPPERRWIVTNREQMMTMRETLPSFRETQYILEPVGRNTAPAIGLSAIHLLHQDPDAVMMLLPADHHIENADGFRECLRKAVSLVQSSDYLATIGIQPTQPETGYGYIQIDRTVGPLAPDTCKVKTFAEKPNLATAKLFLESGEFLWNSGIFVWRADVILQQIAEYLPNWYSGLREIADVLGTVREAEVARQVFSVLKGISIDYGVMEHAPRVGVVKGSFGWSDVGSWEAVRQSLSRDAKGNAAQGNALLLDSSANLVLARERLIALVSVNDLIVVDAGDAILICPREESQRVREIVEALEKTGQDRYL